MKQLLQCEFESNKKQQQQRIQQKPNQFAENNEHLWIIEQEKVHHLNAFQLIHKRKMDKKENISLSITQRAQEQSEQNVHR